MAEVMDALAVQETYFWREIDQLRALVDVVVPQLRPARRTPLRIWSVPCATGEEPLTMAMLLDEAGWFDRAADRAARQRCEPGGDREGRAGPLQTAVVPQSPAGPARKVFRAARRRWTVDPDAATARLLRHRQPDGRDEVRRHASAPVIVCRNVFIYFSDASIRRALGVFERAMPSPGYLCVGASESLLRRTTTFELQEIGGAFMYVKDESRATRQAAACSVERAS